MWPKGRERPATAEEAGRSPQIPRGWEIRAPPAGEEEWQPAGIPAAAPHRAAHRIARLALTFQFVHISSNTWPGSIPMHEIHT
jgi:hypothetical protein